MPTKTRIRVKHPSNQVLINSTHVRHFDGLYRGFLTSLVERDKQNVSGGVVAQESAGDYASWAISQIVIVGIVSQYHLWEKQVRGFLTEQYDRLKLPLPKVPREKTLIEWTRERLEELGAPHPNPTAVWEPIEEGRRVTNCFKHGTEKRHEQLRVDFPDYYHAGTGAAIDLFDPKPTHLEKLTDGMRCFWDELPYEVDYR